MLHPRLHWEKKRRKFRTQIVYTLPAWNRKDADLCSALPNGCRDTTSHLENTNKRSFSVGVRLAVCVRERERERERLVLLMFS